MNMIERSVRSVLVVGAVILIALAAGNLSAHPHHANPLWLIADGFGGLVCGVLATFDPVTERRRW